LIEETSEAEKALVLNVQAAQDGLVEPMER
jgi:hypothetical protein